MIKNTGEIPVVLVHLSDHFVRQLDEDYGRLLEENGGYGTYTIRMEGRREPLWWERLIRFLPGRRDNKEH